MPFAHKPTPPVRHTLATHPTWGCDMALLSWRHGPCRHDTLGIDPDDVRLRVHWLVRAVCDPLPPAQAPHAGPHGPRRRHRLRRKLEIKPRLGLLATAPSNSNLALRGSR